MKQNALTLICDIEDQQLDKLRKVLSDHKLKLTDALGRVGTIHYARWVIIDSHTINNEYLPAQLVFSSNFDGDPDAHIVDLVNKIGAELDLVYDNVRGYDKAGKLAFFRKSRIPEAAFYQGSPGRTLEVIQKEKALHQELLHQINTGNWKGKTAKQIHAQLKKAILDQPQFSWARENIKVPGINYLVMAISILVIILLLPLILVWTICLQIFHENNDQPLGLDPNQLDPKHLEKMELDEDFYFQNQFSQVIDMKPGAMRLITLNAFYMFARVLIRAFFVQGKLMGIPTIHFARWVQINNKKRMLFFSNFDGSWTQYLGDFIDKSGWGLTGIFSNTKLFPRAFMLVFKGAYNERQFLAWARYTQIQTQVWYAADLSQSIKNINNNTIIRNIFPKELNEQQATQFLARI